MEYYKKKYELKVFDFLSSLEIYQKTISLPIFDEMTQDEAHKVCEVGEKSSQYLHVSCLMHNLIEITLVPHKMVSSPAFDYTLSSRFIVGSVDGTSKVFC